MTRSYAKVRTDWDCICSVGLVPVVKCTPQRCSDETIKDALKFLFSAGNVQLLSWRTKRIRIDGKWETFPAVQRTATCQKIYMEYRSHHGRVMQELGVSSKALGRTAFIRIAQTLTKGQRKRKSTVDYVLGALVYDNLRCAREVVCGEVESEDLRKELINQLDAVEQFLKFIYLEHIDVDEDCFHDSTFALEGIPGRERTTQTSSCRTCLTPFQVIRDIRNAIREKREDVLSVLKDISLKMSLYMGHQLRCHNQERSIASLFAELKQDKHCSSAIVLIDYKMKFEAIRYRTTEFFGKRGMSWHGAVVFYSNALGERRAEEAGQQPDESSTDELQTLFFDHILTNDMTQDVGAVASLLDAILARLRVELPTVTELYLLSDNARCYQNDLLPAITPFIAQSHQLMMEGFIHSETQRGKSLVNPHFALAMMHINRFCNETRKDITTPAEIVEALNSFGGTANCTAEMVHLQRNQNVLRQWLDALAGRKLAKLGRVNEFLYTPVQNNETTVKCYKLSGKSYSTYRFGLFHSERTHFSQIEGNNDPNTQGKPIEDGTTDIFEDNNVDENTVYQDAYIAIFNPEEIAFRSEITGVTVWARARLRRIPWRRGRKKSKDIPDISLVEEELRNEEEETGDSDVFGDAESATFLTCDKCGKRYRRNRALLEHQLNCRGRRNSHDVLSVACKMSFTMLGTRGAPIYTTKDIHPSVLSMAINADVISKCKKGNGWAQRPAYGHTLGANTVKRFATDLEKWFMEGQAGKSKKISARRMREMLRKKYPSRYDIPGESFIISFISAQLRRHKKVASESSGRANGNSSLPVQDGGPQMRSKRRMPVLYADKLVELLRENRSLMLRQYRSVLINVLDLDDRCLPEDFSSEQALKNKCSSFRAAMRRSEDSCGY